MHGRLERDRESGGVSEKRHAIPRALYTTNALITGISERKDLQHKNQRPPCRINVIILK